MWSDEQITGALTSIISHAGPDQGSELEYHGDVLALAA